MSDSVWPHRRQPTRLPRPWDSPGKNTGVGCHFLLQCMKVKSESEVAQSCLTLSDPMDCSLPGSSAHGVFQARVLECAAIAFSIKCSLGRMNIYLDWCFTCFFPSIYSTFYLKDIGVTVSIFSKSFKHWKIIGDRHIASWFRTTEVGVGKMPIEIKFEVARPSPFGSRLLTDQVSISKFLLTLIFCV